MRGDTHSLQVGLSKAYKTALILFTHACKHTGTRLTSSVSQTGCENGSLKERPYCRDQARAGLKRNTLLMDVSLHVFAPLPGAWICPSIELCSEVSKSSPDANRNQELKATSVHHLTHRWDVLKRGITEQHTADCNQIQRIAVLCA